MNDFADWLRSLGLVPRTIAADGKWRRCPTVDHPKKRNGAYLLHITGTFGVAQNWAIHDKAVTWKAGGVAELPAVDLAALRRAESEHLEMQRRATMAAREFYAKCTDLRGGHPYLESHGLGMVGCYGIKVDQDGWLVVPAYRGQGIQTVQRISPEGEKRFWPGAPVAGSWHTIGRKPPWTITVLCEGFATGLACYTALLNAGSRGRVIVLWNTGNMEKTAKGLPGMRVIAADNDHQTAVKRGTNPGVETAKRIAEVTGCGIAIPTGITGTDWCDWRMERRKERQVVARMGWETRGQVERAVDAEMTRELMKAAKYVTSGRASA